MYNPEKPYKKQILDIVRKSWKAPYTTVKDSIVTKLFVSNTEYHHVDGIGTKGFYHWEKRSFKNAVIDALAMNLNDLALKRATPYALIDHLFLPEDDDEAILEILDHLSLQCKNRNIAITGGESAIHNNMEGMELSIAVLGFLKSAPKVNRFRKDDVLIGIGSNGLHSNGFTRVRELYGDEFNLEFILPTYIYLDLILDICSEFKIYGMTHITGGAFTKIKDFLKQDENAVVFNNYKSFIHIIFNEIYNKILLEKNTVLTDEEMYRTFNCGVGFIFGIRENDANNCLRYINENSAFRSEVIGRITSGTGKVIIKSNFSNNTIIL